MEAGEAQPGPIESEDPALVELREVWSRGDLVIFAGAGISTAAGLPSWSRLAAMLADHPRMHLEKGRREELRAFLERRRLVDALTVAEQVLGRSEFSLLVERMLNDQDLPVPGVAQALATLAPRLKAVLTTSIDHLIERAFLRQWPPLWKAPIDIVQRRSFILKLHGTLLDRSSWVFTREDYDHATWGHGSIRETLARFFHAFPLLFVGYELEDEDFESVLAQVRALAGDHPPRHFALVPTGSIQGVRRQSLERAGIRLIEYANPDGQHAEVERLLRSLAGSSPEEEARHPAGAPVTTAGGAGAGLPQASVLPERSPFPGLEYFDEDRADLFFGRETEVGEALQLLGETPRGHMRWLQVEGASGTGKSSFARAGLVPKVRLGWVGGAPAKWCTAVLRPGRQPLLSLAQAVLTALRPEAASLEGLIQQLRSSPTALASFLRQHTPPGYGFLLLVDQFEEVFTLAEEDSRRAFEQGLASALEDTSGPLYLVTTLRGDFLGHFDALPGLKKLLSQLTSHYPLRAMSPLGLQAAIKKPAECVGLSWQPGLPERLLEDVSDLEAGLPLLAHALRELWVARSGQTLTHDAYNAFGGTLGALTRSADQLLASLGPEGGERARQLLLALVTLQGGKASRRFLTRAEALRAAGGGSEAEQVLVRLSGGRSPTQPETAAPPVRLVVATQSEGQDRIDLVHEALLTRWSTLSKWLEMERKVLARRDDLEAAARSWMSAGAPRSDLPSGAQLAYLQTASPSTDLARQFLIEATALERRRKHRLLTAIALLVVGLVSVSALSVYAWRQRELAQQRLVDALAVADRVAFEIADKLQPLSGAAEIRRGLLESTAKLLDKLLEGAQGNSGLLRSRMATHNQRGDLALTHDDLMLAYQQYAAGRDIAQKLATLYPDSSIARYDLAVSVTKLGDVARAQGRFTEARDFFQQGLELTQALAQADPSNATLQSGVVANFSRLGEVAAHQGRLTDARDFFQQGLELTQTLIRADPSNAVLQANLSTNFTRLGDVARDQGRFTEARDFYHQGLELMQALANAAPFNASFQRDLSASFTRLGALATHQGRLTEARGFFQQGLGLREALAKADPSNAELKLDCAASESLLADLARRSNSSEELHIHRSNAERILDELRKHKEIARNSRYQELHTFLGTLPR
jgi:tetratricopeptide (TPR) repeat protein